MTDFNLVLSQVRQRLEILYQIVDELEAQGGGGGGTDSYNDLSNKPQINGHTLTGNKTGSDLGLASTSDLSAYLKSNEAAATYQTLAGMSDYLTSSDAASTYQTQAGMSSYYTKTETDAEIASEIVGAINDLDVASVGGSTKYLTTISEANGIIDATAASPDTVPTTDSTKLITSGGVKTYVDNAVANKITLTDAYGLGTALTTGADLDTYNSNAYIGSYYTANSNIASSCLHKPDYENASSKGFRLEVKTGTGNTRIIQELTTMQTSGAGEGTIEKFMRCYTSAGWGAWVKLCTPADTVTTIYGVYTAINITASGFDCDTALTPGIYIAGNTTYAQNTKGRPDYDNAAANIWRMEVKLLNSVRVYQEMIVYRVGTYEGDFDRYQRMRRTDGTWNSWQHIDTTDVNTYYPPAPNNLSNSLMNTGFNAELTVEPDEDEPQDER